jgi:hypothetical protein
MRSVAVWGCDARECENASRCRILPERMRCSSKGSNGPGGVHSMVHTQRGQRGSARRG